MGYFANAQYDVHFLRVILNDSEESHRRTDGYIFLALVVGYFADAQYDVLFLRVILNDSEESHRRTEGAYMVAGRLID